MQLIDLSQRLDLSQRHQVDSPWLHLTRSQCFEKLQMQNLDYINFARWLAIPSLNEILVFKHGICCHIEQGLIR